MVAGSGFAPGEVVTSQVDSGAAVQTVRADARGSFDDVRVAAPADGDHAIGATGGGLAHAEQRVLHGPIRSRLGAELTAPATTHRAFRPSETAYSTRQ